MSALLRHWRRAGLRRKLLWLALLPLLVVQPLLGAILLIWGNTALDELLITKVRSDLAVARGYFERVQAEVGSGTQAAAATHRLVQLLAPAPGLAVPADALPAFLADARRHHGLEFLNLLAPDGRLLARESGPVDPGPPMPLLVADESGALASVAVVDREALARVAPQLLPRLAIPLLPTLNAAPTERRSEERAMLLIARAPVRDGQGRLLGHLQGGVLLNRNLDFIDHINEIVYPDGSLPAGSQGTATLFLDDVRISTNVRLFQGDAAGTAAHPGPHAAGERAIGTRVSREVREAVLGRGGTWLARAFVVNDWYVSAYQPVVDRDGRRVGMLYVGFLERPFVKVKYAVLGGIGVVFIGVMLAVAWVSLRLARSIFRPVERMERTMRRVESGDAAARVGPLASSDEIGRLAGHLDQLLDSVDDKARALQRWGEELDRKVAERTAELRAAQQQLVRSEKLATVGQLTASIAHEINNPIAVIQGNLDLMRELLGPAAEPAREEIRLIDAQVERMRLIVTQLLQYARPGEYAGYVEQLDAGEALDACLPLVQHLLAGAGVRLERDYRGRRRVAINRQELQQVLVNLLVNAAQAMPQGGLLQLSTEDRDDEQGRPGLLIRVRDSGTGLSPALQDRLFQPFVTGKREGTGLGLWISRSLVERYAGSLRVEPLPEGEPGACFALWLQGGD